MTRRRIDVVRGGAILVLVLAMAVPAVAQAEWRHLQGGKYGGAFFLDANRGWLTADAHIMYTTNGGADWTEAGIPEAATNDDVRVDFRGMLIYQDGLNVRGWAVGDGGVVLTVTDTLGHEWGDLNPTSRVLDACDSPGRLYDIYMFPPLYTSGWCVGENGAIATTGDGGETWSKANLTVDPTFFACDPGDREGVRDAYDVHFFDSSNGIIAGEYRSVYTTTNGGTSWDRTDVVTSAGSIACPVVGAENLEFWGLDFDDPNDPASGVNLSGGVGNQRGYMFRTEGL